MLNNIFCLPKKKKIRTKMDFLYFIPYLILLIIMDTTIRYIIYIL